MKKIFFFIFIIVSFSISESAAQFVRFGITAAGNSCTLHGPDAPIINNKTYGYSGGFFIDARFAEHMSTQTEIKFTKYQFSFSEKIENIEDGYLNTHEINNYITVPVMLKYKRGHEFVFYYLSIGGQVSVLVKHKQDVYATSRGLVIDSESYYNYKHNWYDYGFKGSTGFQFKPITIGLSLYTSMRNLYKREEPREMRYNIVSLDFSYQFNYRDATRFSRKTGWQGFKYKITHLFK